MDKQLAQMIEMEVLGWGADELASDSTPVAATAPVHNDMGGDTVVLPIPDIATPTAAAPIPVSITNMDGQGVIIPTHTDGNAIALPTPDPPAATPAAPATPALPAGNTVASPVPNTATPITTHSEGDTVATPIFSVATVLPDTSTHSDTNMDGETVVMPTPKIAIPVANASAKSRKRKTAALPAIATATDPALTTSSKNRKRKTVEITTTTDASPTDGDTVALPTPNPNPKVSAAPPSKKRKQRKLSAPNTGMSVEPPANVTTANPQPSTQNATGITVEPPIAITRPDTVNATGVEVGVASNDRNPAAVPERVIELKDLSLDALKAVMDMAREEVVRTAVPLGHSGIKVDYNGESVLIGHMIKFLPIPFRFEALHGKLGVLAEGPPAVPTKPTTNTLITKIKVGVATDAAKNKIYKHGEKALIVSGRDAYMVVQVGGAMEDAPETHSGTKYNIVDDFGSIMKASAVWFFPWFPTKRTLQDAANQAADDHQRWLQKALQDYRADTTTFVKARKGWEWKVTMALWNNHRAMVTWPTKADLNTPEWQRYDPANMISDEENDEEDID
ncbi:hypothetical protein MMC06_005832 [Schaereria dolodes]|nr:hypothetical protein [Schaereria dolodes]